MYELKTRHLHYYEGLTHWKSFSKDTGVWKKKKKLTAFFDNLVINVGRRDGIYHRIRYRTLYLLTLLEAFYRFLLFFFFSSRQDINWESFMIRTKYMAQRKLETNSAEKKDRKNMNSKKYSRYFCVKILLSMKWNKYFLQKIW